MPYLNRLEHNSCTLFSCFPIPVPWYLLFPPCRMPSSRTSHKMRGSVWNENVPFPTKQEKEAFKVTRIKAFYFFLCISSAHTPIRLHLQNKLKDEIIKMVTVESETKCGAAHVTAEVTCPLISPALIHLGLSPSFPTPSKDKSKAVSAGQIRNCPRSALLQRSL